MTAASFVEKVLVEASFTTGVIRLTPGEIETLALPAHPESVRLQHRDETILTDWQFGRRELGGEPLLDLVELHGQVEGLIRVHPAQTASGPLILQFLDRPASVERRGLIEVVRQTGGHATTTAGASEPSQTWSTSRRVAERARIRDRNEFDWNGRVGILKASVDSLRSNASAGGWDDPETYDLRVAGETLAAVSGFDELLALDLCDLDHMEHQEATALKVLGGLHGRAVLADEVGLGKTIEAGLILKELIVRGMANRILIVCPATLREQWQAELHEKFHEDFEVVMSGKDPMDHDKMILSRQLATRETDRLAGTAWDLLIVDEAHRMAGPSARKARAFLQQVESRYALYLTATPVQNDLLELYRLVDTLRPGTFASQRDFKRRFMNGPREPKDPAALRTLIADVMVRTTRAQAGLDKIDRIPRDSPITLSKPERRAYDLCVNALREHMNRDGDHFRRRHLAHRLTTSPRALGQTARKMAPEFTDPAVRSVLEELADLCAEFGITSRQKKLLELATTWVEDPDKGRVLIFTQHTDTLEDLLRVLDLHDVQAVPFHGGMSPTAKQASIDKFRAGRGKGVPVMVSTDAGAEGLNLQFANCVVNYDLPWNPMRIEQRIGRVHRVTQQRNVYVANFFAKDTIDESVYRLLHDKLRMFELLFGQVTTILGELDDDGNRSSSFDSRVLEALLAEDDQAMVRRLEILGTKVDRAYKSAQEQMSSGTGHLTSLVFDTSHRKGLKKGGATELAPRAIVRDRQRRLDVEKFVRRYLDVIGATIQWDNPGNAAAPGFLTVNVPEEAQPDLGGRTELHLAFGGEAMAQHVDAELCAVGTEIFEQIVDSFADKGDLVGFVPNDSLLEPETAWFQASEGVRFERRERIASVQYDGEAVWRVRSTTHRHDYEVVTTAVGDPQVGGWSKLLTSGEPLAGRPPAQALDRLVRAAVPELDELAASAQEEATEIIEAEHARLASYHEDRISELQGELRRASSGSENANDLVAVIERLQTEQRRARDVIPPTAEVEAELLATRLVACPVVKVKETWSTGDGKRFSIKFSWDMREPHPDTFTGADGMPVHVVSLCHDGHVIDEPNRRTCPGCKESSCAACPGGIEFASCLVCQTPQCGRCLSGGICGHCSQPTINTDGGLPTLVELGFGAVAEIGHHRIRIVDATGAQRRVLTDLGRSMSNSTQYDRLVAPLPTDIGVARGGDAHFDVPDDEWAIEIETVDEWHVDPSGGPEVAADLLGRLPISSTSNAEPDAQDGAPELTPWATALVAQTDLVPGPSLVLTTAIKASTLAIADDHLVVRRRWIRSDGSAIVFDTIAGAMRIDESWMLGAGTTWLPVRRAHRSFEVTIGSDTCLLTEGTSSPSDERSFGALADSLGSPGSQIVGILPDGPLDLAEPQGDVVLVDRTVEPYWAPCTSSGDVLERWPDALPRPTTASTGTVIVAKLAHADLNRRLPLPPDLRLELRQRLTEVWRSPYGEARSERDIAPGASALPTLDDTFQRSTVFGIDSLGHLHAPNGSWACPVCRDRRCGGCGDSGIVDECEVCNQPACGFCRQPGDAPGVITATCVVCERHSCTACGTTFEAISCTICRRTACTNCSKKGRCSTCVGLSVATDPVRTSLPPQLAVANGCDIYAGEDAGGTVVLIVSSSRLELAHVDGGRVRSWVSAGSASSKELSLILEVADRLGGRGDLDVTLHVAPPLNSEEDELALHQRRQGVLLLQVEHPVEGVLLDQRIEVDDIERTTDYQPDSVLSLAIERAVDGERLVPTRCPPEHERALLDLRNQMSAPALGPSLLLTATEEIEFLVVSAAGLESRSGRSDDFVTRRADWESCSEGVSENWRSMVPGELAALASLDACSVALVSAGPFRLLGVHLHDDVQVWRLDDHPGFPGLIHIAEWLGTGLHPITIASCVLPDDEPCVRVGASSLESRAWTPVVQDDESTNPPDATALSRILHSAPTVDPHPAFTRVRRDLPGLVRDRLGAVADASLDMDARSIAVGFSCTDIWTTPVGPATVRYHRMPGDLRAEIDPTPGRVLGPLLHVDRAGHLADVLSTCPYCSTATCDECEDRVRACLVCDQPFCGGCGAGRLGVCASCGSLERLGRLARRRMANNATVALHGLDDLHSVLVVPAAGGRAEVIVSRAGEPEKRLDRRIPAGVAAMCNEISRSTAFT